MDNREAEKLNIAKPNIHIILDVLREYGVCQAVVSPGSRNAPIVVALRRAGFKLTMVIDERTAGFVGLGIALRTDKPVILCCTSGTAMLNYAPALAEAYYRRIPLIALTADRPYYSIDQRDGQTIRQTEALSAVTRCCVDIQEYMKPGVVNRLVNKALWAATDSISGPVQINIGLSVPLTPLEELSPDRERGFRIHSLHPSAENLPDELLYHIRSAESIALINASLNPDEELNSAITSLSNRMLCFSEVFSGISGAFPTSAISESDTPPQAPDLLLLIGGPVVSDKLKLWLRKAKRLISIGYDDEPVDTYRNLHACVQMPAAQFLKQLPETLPASAQYFRESCESIKASLHDVLSDRLFNGIFNAVSAPETNIILSNGMTVRRAGRAHLPAGTVYANRGVSGIDGVSSTAVGIHIADPKALTLLISGDMSAAYDIGALAVHGIGANFKMIVINNGGGDIFRNVSTTSALPERDRYFVAAPRLPLSGLADAYGYEYFRAEPADIDAAMSKLLNSDKPAILEIKEF